MQFRMKIKSLLVAVPMVLVALLSSCKKDAGEGGTSSIVGRVWIYRYDLSLMQVVDTVIGSREDVYIIYGADHATYDDDFQTSFDGTYEFSNLRKGNYQLFAYSEDTTGLYDQSIPSNLPKKAVFKSVEITDNKSDFTAPDIIIFKER